MKIDFQKIASFLWKNKETIYRIGKIAIKFVKDKFKKEDSNVERSAQK